MNYIELMNEKSNIAAARAALDEQEKKLDEQIKLASHSYARSLLDRILALGKQIEELDYCVVDPYFDSWIDFDSLRLECLNEYRAEQ